MKFFIDTAHLQDIEKGLSCGLVDGVTTNPSLMAKLGINQHRNILEHYKKIAEIVPGPVSAEVLSTGYEDMIAEGEELADMANNIVVKVPMTVDGLRAIRYFSAQNIATNCTLIFSATQALLAAKAGATYVSPFIGRLDDISQEGMELIKTIRQIFDNYNFGTEILAASIRHPLHILESAKIGADVITAPLQVLLQLADHPLTQAGLAKFIADSQAFKK